MVVSNASPLISLARVNRLDLLKELFGEIFIEEEVRKEVVDRGKEEGATDSIAIEKCIQEGRIKVKKAKKKGKIRGIHPGEANTIQLARELDAEVLIDEEDAREIARALGLKTIGTLYVLGKCNKKGIISKKEAIGILDDMLENGFRLSAHLYAEFIKRFES